jgi:phospholipid/cholesterol/gamma-HCH transport system substrate-binding protein
MSMGRHLKVGLFVIVGLACLAVGIFLIGQNRKFWESKVTFHAAFRDVQGLKPGAPVRMGGLDIGSVTAVGHGDTATDTRIYVTLDVTKGEAPRIREDTIAQVVNKGLLGDKMIDLSVADGSKPPLDPAKLITTTEPKDLLANADQLAGKVKGVVEQLEPLAKSLGDPKFSDDIKGSVASLRRILDGIANDDSIAHRMLFDPNEAQKFSTMTTNFAGASQQVNGILTDVHDVSTHAKNGPGIVHALVYDGDMSANAAGALGEVHQDLQAIREGNGIAHALLYGDDSTQHVMGNMSKMSDDLRDIVAGVKAGKGTIGALLVDPSVYEDIKSAIGNVERNQVLRALVRYSIKADEAHPAPATPPVPASP